jgi:small-conductance mechanosensitive channel
MIFLTMESKFFNLIKLRRGKMKMKSRQSKIFVLSLSLVLCVFLLVPTQMVLAQDTGPDQSSKQVGNLASEAAPGSSGTTQMGKEESGTRNITARFYAAAQRASAAIKRVGSIISGKGRPTDEWGDAMAKLSDGKGAPYLLKTLMGLAVIIALGLVLRGLFRRTSAGLYEHLISAVRLGKLQFFGRVLSRMILDALGIGVYVLTTFILFVFVYTQGKPDYVIVSLYLIISYYILFFTFMARVIFAPKAPSLRLFPMEDLDATFLYKWILRIVFMAGIVAGTSLIFNQLDVSRQLSLLMYGIAGAVVILALVIMIWQSRKRVAQAIWTEESDAVEGARPIRAAFARNWHYFATLYVLATGGFWIASALSGGNVTVINLIISIFLIPIVFGVDQWVQRLLKIASGEARELIDLSGDAPSESGEQQEPDSKMDIKHYVPLIKKSFRFFLVAFLIFGSLRLWGVDISIGRVFTRSALSILVILLLSFISWQLIKARIDQKLKEEMSDDDEEKEEGGAGGSRMGTLLLLLRKFVLTVMFLLVSLIILSSLGIDIGPLIAGAGVLGLAIGFGAQTLVKDIISGIFFLLDDAFRLGDFVEISGNTGSVEKISLRSLKLRHPRGMVFTIPFGGMGTVTNLSRDYVITKLDFRVRYDTKVDKVRKIIKKINKDIMKDEKMGSVLLGKIKSQGVKELDDSAMIMRVKFKTVPGEQFVIRREVYRLMQEKFKENGIEFAHRNVTVYLPPETAEASSADGGGAEAKPKVDKKVLEAAGAAAAAQIEGEAKKK